jgi:Glycosyl hydrolases family 18
VSDYLARMSNRRVAAGALTATLVVALGAFGLGQLNAAGQAASPPTETAPASMAPVVEPAPASDELPLALGTAGIGSVWAQLAQPVGSLAPTPPGEFAQPAPASLATEPPIRTSEEFGVIPYWALPSEATLDLKGLTTVVYTGLEINPDGSIQTSGGAWNGFLSQDFVNLIDEAHAEGVRVVLSVYDFDQTSLNQLAANPTAPNQLAQSLLLLVKMRDLDGVNLDLEGQGAQDQTGVTNLVAAVSRTLKAYDGQQQVTVDTDASSAGSSDGIYDLSALDGSVDAFLVTEDQLNLSAIPDTRSEMTSAGESLQATLNEYVSQVPANKLIAILPLFGLEWPTSDDTLQAKPLGTGVAIPGAALPRTRAALWDPITQTAWSSFQVGEQWNEVFFETPRSLRLASRTAQANGIAGIGVWGLGTNGSTTDAAIVSALAPRAPAQTPSASGTASTTVPGSASNTNSSTTTTTSTRSKRSTAHATSASTTTTTTAPPPFSGVWIGSRTDVVPAVVPSGTLTAVGVMTRFKTSYPGLTCLNQDQYLDVYGLAAQPGYFYVIAQTAQNDCMNAAFVFYDPDSPVPSSGS